ncbi:amidase [Corynebacterium suedekumii]|uniref:Amidase n=1 Tax=Corynebacterium suedekumii TaxID=3049801 RepID=A0ABY8VKQ2_9CORY|nr:amidase [Corynebacterium suedekumii]WIM70226.1 amidase [Corynebacterium suedekumii]
MSSEILTMTGVEVGTLMARGHLSPVEVTQLTLEHAHDLNPALNAYISFCDDQALAEAAQAEEELKAGRSRGPLYGVPVALKDSVFVKDEVTTLGSKIHGEFRPPHDAAVVEKLRAAGAVIVGKLNMHEYAWGLTNDNPWFGVTRNPWNPEKLAGGSSGGSGVAPAANMNFLTIGADAAGSIRVPSSVCGGVGLKATYGRVSTFGDFPLAWTIGHVGPMVKDVTDAAATLQAIAGFDHRDPASVNVAVPDFSALLDRDVDGLVIGIEEDYFFRDVDSRIEEVVRGVIDQLVERGAVLRPVSIPVLAHAQWACYMTILAEASAVHHENLVARPDDIGQDVRAQLRIGELISAVEYLQAQQVRRQLKEEFTHALAEVDVILTPTMPVMTPDVGTELVELNGETLPLRSQFTRFCVPTNLTGHPSMTVPAGLVDGLPVGVQIIGSVFDEATVLRAGRGVEKLGTMSGQHPQVS